ncbi:two-component system, OmpR family, sensor histidine kinase TctE [Paracidovorax valerianellae]|uniref:histidine kinase n=1 Tax=Paracidovorax valerianellae TaxID=187868 RepID=A0A1G6R913_9BURK|nr:sensor histidine kinase [Paracidovorax valerianellae]SDD00941.1 two-component system, OmpR family, sensor histidine kinase TctE [Paracidovorax valerianellae]
MTTAATPSPKPAGPSVQRTPHSLRARLLRHVLVPLGLTWLVGTAGSVLLANAFTQRAFDRSLLDDAYAVAANVRLKGDALDFALTSREVKAVLFDQVETVYFAVLRPDGSMLAGNAGGLPVPPPRGDEAYRFSDIQFHGRALRAVRLDVREPQPFEVVTAQTVHSRSAMLRSVLLYSGVSQLLLLVALAVWLRRAIQRDLQPLAAFQQALDQRDARDLAPVPVQASTSDVQHLGAAVNDLLARVAQGVRAQREFAGNVAHELRTPLAGIRALAAYGLAHKDPAVWREQLAGIADSEARASHLVDQLLALALADEARGAMPRQPVALDELARDAVLRFLPRADAAGVDLGATGLDQPVVVLGQPLLIEGVLGNLIDNALRYGRPPAGGRPRVTVEIARETTADGRETIALAVVDNGPGLSAAQRTNLLQRWAQGREGERLGQGAGLGLAIVARYAELLGVRLALEPGPHGEGLRVRLVFAG